VLGVAILGCTAFVLGQGGGAVVAKSYDWHLDHALVIVNKRGVAKKALKWRPGDTPAEWTSRYGSVTFNQYGRDLPNGGMNEAGLVVEVLWLDETKYAEPDDRPVVSELQWIQMQLDRHATLAEVEASAHAVRIHSDAARVHYLVCDKVGKCLSIEMLGGKAVVRKAAALTNSTHAESERHLVVTGTRAVPRGTSSLDRFVRASVLARTSRGKDPVETSFGILESVAQGDYSKWNIVYEPAHKRVSWRTRRSPAVKSLDLDAFDLSCGEPAAMMDIDEPPARLRKYDARENRRIAERSLADLGLPSVFAGQVATYPETTRCTP
jgi:penicillin V acylase-like amidase (Ntn superfamily)